MSTNYGIVNRWKYHQSKQTFERPQSSGYRIKNDGHQQEVQTTNIYVKNMIHAV